MMIYIKDPDALGEIKCLVFDVDGVLVDVSQSFRQMIALATDYYFRLKLGLKGRRRLAGKEAIDVFKKIGGFNNDWDLTCAIVFLYLNFYLKKGRPETLDDLKVEEKDFISAVLEIDGLSVESGLEAFLEKTRTYFGTDAAKDLFNRKLVEDICKLLYAGNRTGEVYGEVSLDNKEFEKRLKKFNLHEREKKLLEENFLPNGVTYGLVTGRAPGELNLLNESFPFLFSKAKHVVYDDGNMPRKPQPQVMERFIEEDLLPLIFVGDSRDDFETVKNVRKYYRVDGVFFAAVASSFDGFDFFLKLNSDFVCTDVNLLLLAVGESREHRGK